MESRPPYPPPGTYGQPPPSYPPHGAYGQPPSSYAPPAYPGHPHPQVTNSKAVVSLVAGIAAWVILPVLAAVVAVITGHMARQEIRRDPYQTGDGMAVAGLVLGWIQIALAIVALVVVFVIFVIIAAIVGASNA